MNLSGHLKNSLKENIFQCSFSAKPTSLIMKLGNCIDTVDFRGLEINLRELQELGMKPMLI